MHTPLNSPERNALIDLAMKERSQFPSMEDTGSREQHLLDLLTLWEFLEDATSSLPTFRRTETTDSIMYEMPAAIRALKRTLTAIPGNYNEAYYDLQAEAGSKKETPKQ